MKKDEPKPVRIEVEYCEEDGLYYYYRGDVLLMTSLEKIDLED